MIRFMVSFVAFVALTGGPIAGAYEFHRIRGNGPADRILSGVTAKSFARSTRAESSLDPIWEKRWWLEKAARALRAGEGISPDEDVEALMALDKKEIVRRLMSDPRFGDAILGFNVHFLGGRVDSVRGFQYDAQTRSTYLGYSFVAKQFPQAFVAARNLLEGKDYLALFDLRAPFLMEPLNNPYSKEPIPDPVPPGFFEKLRRENIASTLVAFDGLIADFKVNPPANYKEACERIRDKRSDLSIDRIGVWYFITSWVRRGPVGMRNLEFACELGPPPGFDFVAELERLRGLTEGFFRLALTFEDPNYRVQSVTDYREIDLESIGVPRWHVFGSGLGFSLTNSSTNFNRKRGAYILKTYFCDDLTPINVQVPDDHARTQHGRDVACYACHYKLDPMAGFFRSYGEVFNDFSSLPVLTFDDAAKTDRRAYEANWKAPADSGREWDVGYVRAAEGPGVEKNEYGSTIDDLQAIIRRAPEARRCLVQRTHQYLVGENQLIDGDYLDWLTERFNERAKTSSAGAVKELWETILTSRAFSQPDPRPDECYDLKPGATKSQLPCQVSSVINNHCVNCHGPSSSNGLDLTRYPFPGRDVRATLESIVDRLQTTDPERRMPLSSHMPSADRERLYLWAKEQLK